MIIAKIALNLELFISVSESKSHGFRMIEPLTCFDKCCFTLLKQWTHLLLNLLLQCTIDFRNVSCSKLTATDWTVVHISLDDLYVALVASEMFACWQDWLNTKFKANRASKVLLCLFILLYLFT